MPDDVLMFKTGFDEEQLQYLLQFVKNGHLHVHNPEFDHSVFLSRLP